MSLHNSYLANSIIVTALYNKQFLGFFHFTKLEDNVGKNHDLKKNKK